MAQAGGVYARQDSALADSILVLLTVKGVPGRRGCTSRSSCSPVLSRRRFRCRRRRSRPSTRPGGSDPVGITSDHPKRLQETRLTMYSEHL